MNEWLLKIQARLARQVDELEDDGSDTALDAAVILTDAVEALEKLIAEPRSNVVAVDFRR